MGRIKRRDSNSLSGAYYAAAGSPIDALPAPVMFWDLKEQSGTTANDTGSGIGLLGGPYNAPYTVTPTQISGDADLGDCLEFDRLSDDKANAGDVESTTGIAKITFIMAIKSNDVANAGESVMANNKSGTNNGDFAVTIGNGATDANFVVQTDSAETKVLTATIVNNAKEILLSTWDSVAKTLAWYRNDIGTAAATSTYAGNSVPFKLTEDFKIGADASNAAGFRGNNFRVYDFIADEAQRNLMKAIT